MAERMFRVGPIRCALHVDEPAVAAVDEWLAGSDADPSESTADLSFEFSARPPPAPIGQPRPLVVGGAAMWRDGDTIELRTGRHVGGRVNLASGRGKIWIDERGGARRTIHTCFRPLLVLAAGRAGWHGVHAAAVVVDGMAVLLVADSGVGKSTTAVRMAAAGYPLVGDDIVFVDEGSLRVVGTPEPPRLDAHHAAALGLTGRAHLDGKITLTVPCRSTSSTPTGLVALLDPTAGRAVTKATPGETMTALMRAGLLTVDPKQDPGRMATLARLASTCPSVRLHRQTTPGPIREEVIEWLSTASDT